MNGHIKNMTIPRTYLGILAFLVLMFISADQPDSAPAKKGKKKSPAAPALSLRARAALVMDTESRLIMYSKNLTEKRPIASLTKLMTALIFLDTKPDLGEPLILQYEDRAPRGGKSLFRVGETFHLMDLLYASLMTSDNLATKALARSTNLSPTEFVARMNLKAESLGLLATSFADPTGLESQNISTALDCAKLLMSALQDTLISKITSTKQYSIRSLIRRRKIVLQNTCRLLNYRTEILGAKTGFIVKSGYCLVTCAENSSGKKLAFVVLGAPSNYSRFRDMQRLMDWSFKFSFTN